MIYLEPKVTVKLELLQGQEFEIIENEEEIAELNETHETSFQYFILEWYDDMPNKLYGLHTSLISEYAELVYTYPA